MFTAQEVIYRPRRPVRSDGAPLGPVAGKDLRFYLVLQESNLIVAYNSTYFPSINDVVADLVEMIGAGLEGPWGDDYAVWRDGRLMATIHLPMDGKHRRVTVFNDPRNDPGAAPALPGWPSREEWVASGRDHLRIQADLGRA